MGRTKVIIEQENHNLVGEEREQSINERKIEFIATLLNSIVAEDGAEALQGQTWVSLIVNKAHKLGIRNASEEMLIERFKNEGLIDLDKDVTRLRTESYYNNAHLGSTERLTLEGGLA